MVDGKRYLLGFTGLEEYLAEGLEFLNGTLDTCLEVADVELDGLCTSHSSRIRDGDGESDLVVNSQLLFIGSGLA